MKKVIWLITTAALVAVSIMGIAAQGAVAYEPQGPDDCPTGTGAKLMFGWVQTTETDRLTEAGLKGGAVMCGNDDEQQGVGYKEGLIITTGIVADRFNPSDKYGMELRCANPDHDRAGDNVCGGVGDDLEATSYIGRAGSDLVLWLFGFYGGLEENIESRTYVDHLPGGIDWTCPASEDPDGPGGWMPEGPVVQCQLGTNPLGWSVITVVKIASGAGAGASTGQYVIHLHEPTSWIIGTDLYYAKFGSRGLWNETSKQWYKDPSDDDLELTTCKYAGAVGGGDQCSNDPNRWLQKTGWSSFYQPAVSGWGQVLPPSPFTVRGIYFNGSQWQNKNTLIKQKWNIPSNTASSALGKARLGKDTVIK